MDNKNVNLIVNLLNVQQNRGMKMVDIFSLDFNEFLIWWDCSDTTSQKSIKLRLTDEIRFLERGWGGKVIK